MIDFTVYLEPNDVELEAMRAMAARHPNETPSVNQTWHVPLQIRPITVNIETKRTGEGWDAAMLQSGVWVAAQLIKLKQLATEVNGDFDSIPALPLLVVQGHDWYFLAASPGRAGQTVCPVLSCRSWLTLTPRLTIHACFSSRRFGAR